MFERPFSEGETPEGRGSGEKEGPEYIFEGFNIEFSDKISLTPFCQTAQEKGVVAHNG